MDQWPEIANQIAASSALIRDHLALFFTFWVLSFAVGAGFMRLLMADRIRANEALFMSAQLKAHEAEVSAGDKWREFEARAAAHAQRGEAEARQREAEARQMEADARAAETEAKEEVDKLRLISIRLLGITQKDHDEIERGKNEIEAHARKAGAAVTNLLQLSRSGEIPWPRGFIPIQLAWPMEGIAHGAASAGADRDAAGATRRR